MVVLPNVAPAHEPCERRHFSDRVALVTLVEERPGKGGAKTGVAELPVEKETAWLSGELPSQMHPRREEFNSSRPRFNAPSPLQAIAESLGSVPVGWCLPLEALLVFLRHPAKIGSVEFAVVTFSG